MRILSRQSCILGAILFVVGCGADVGDLPFRGDNGSEDRGGSATGGTKNTAGTNHKGGDSSSAQNSGTGGKAGATTGAGGDSSEEGGSTGAGGRKTGKGGSGGDDTGGRSGDGGGPGTAKGGNSGKGGGTIGTGGGSPGTGGRGPGPAGGFGRGGNPGTGGSSPGAGGVLLGRGGNPGTGGSSPGAGGRGPAAGGSSPGAGGSTSVIPSTCSEGSKTLTSNGTGQHCGYTYEYWKDQGTGTLTLKPDGFSVDWSNINNLLGRKGVRPGTGNEVITYEANYQPNGNSYLGIYGWFKNPLVEYYIVDSWGTWRPPGGQGLQGTVTCDGATYDIYKVSHTGPTIEGSSSTFNQYFSVRQQERTSGSITVSCHIAAWKGKGMTVGSFYEVSMLVEGYQSSGKADVKMSIK